MSPGKSTANAVSNGIGEQSQTMVPHSKAPMLTELLGSGNELEVDAGEDRTLDTRSVIILSALQIRKAKSESEKHSDVATRNARSAQPDIEAGLDTPRRSGRAQ
jgi:hypothetical protein